MSQNASGRGVRRAVLESRLGEFAGYRLAVNCGNRECGGERAYAVADLALMYGERTRMGLLITRLRCRSCGKAARTCFIETGPELAARGRMRRLALIGPQETRE